MPGYGRVATSIERRRSSRPHRQPVADRRDGDTHVGEPAQQHLHVVGPCAAQHDLAAAHGDGREVGGRLDAVGDDRVIGGVQRTGLDAVHDQRRRSDALDVGAHRRQHRAQVGDLRLARRVVDDGRALGVHGRGEDVLGGADARELERDVGAVQAIGGRLDVAVLHLERRAHRLETLHVHVDRPAAEVVAARQRQRDLAAATEQRTEHVDRGADALDELVRSDRRDVTAIGHRDRSIAVERRRHADRRQQIAHDRHVGDGRHVGAGDTRRRPAASPPSA